MSDYLARQLVNASHFGHDQEVLELLQREASPNLARQLFQASHDQEVLELLQRGAPPNSDYYTREERGWTPLHQACADNHLCSAELLIKFGAIVTATDNDGFTPLHWACLYNSEDIAKLLLVHHCPTDIKNSVGQTAADVAKRRYRALADYVEGFQPGPRDPLSSYPTLEQLCWLECDQWLQLGVCLGLGNAQLETIKKSQHPTALTLQAAKIKYIDLQWKDIMEALVSIGEYKLAESVCTRQDPLSSYPTLEQLCWLECDQWLQLGVCLGLGNAQLETIKKNQHPTALTLQAAKIKCSDLQWKDIVEALVSIGEYKLAESVCTKQGQQN